MEDNKQAKEPEKKDEGWGRWIYKQVVGTAAITALTAAGGAVWGAVKKTGVTRGAKSGALLGLVGALGLGGFFYDGIEAIFGKNKQPENSTQSPQELKTSTDKLEIMENPNAKGGHAEKILAEKNQQKSLQAL